MDGGVGIERRVAEAPTEDAARGIVRIDPADMERIGAHVGEVVRVHGKRAAHARVYPTRTADRGKGIVQADALVRRNARVNLGEPASIVQVAACPAAERVLLVPLGGFPDRDGHRTKELSSRFQSMVVQPGDYLCIDDDQLRPAEFIVKSTEPAGPAEICEETALQVGASESGPRTTYADVGGLTLQLQRVREVVELPLLHPEVFERLGIEPPKGVLLYGPPGTGKTLVARAVAGETSAHFIHVSGPEIFHKFYGESESRLREVFREARENAPSVIFFDEIDAVALKREDVYGDVEKRVVAQLMALMDGLESREQVIVIAATNAPDMLDPALRRPGRFDREIHVPVPGTSGRLEILAIHTHPMPLAADVDLASIADLTHGFVGADLANLCREAAMVRLRKEMAPSGGNAGDWSPSSLESLIVSGADFFEALAGLKPAAMRGLSSETPRAGWSDVAGLEEAKQALDEAIVWPTKYPALFQRAQARPPKGVLLYGPSGAGKTLLARAVAGESKSTLIPVRGAELLSKWLGETEKGVREAFRRARTTAPCILFFDDLAALAPARDAASDTQVTDRIVSQLLTEMDELAETDGIVVMAAANRPEAIDAALLTPGRFELVIELPLPAKAARLEIFQLHLNGKPLADDVEVETLADLTDGWTGGRIGFVCRRATMLAVREQIERGQEPEPERLALAARHFRKAIGEARRPPDLHGLGGTGAADPEPSAAPDLSAAATRSPTKTRAPRAARVRRSSSRERTEPGQRA